MAMQGLRLDDAKTWVASRSAPAAGQGNTNSENAQLIINTNQISEKEEDAKDEEIYTLKSDITHLKEKLTIANTQLVEVKGLHTQECDQLHAEITKQVQDIEVT